MPNQRLPLTYEEEVIGNVDVNENYDVVHAEITEPGPLYDMHMKNPQLQWGVGLVLTNEQIDHAEYIPMPATKEN